MNLTSPSSTSSSSNSFSFSSGSSSSSTSPSPLRKMRILNDLYKITNPIDNDVILYCHLATCDPIVFEEAIKDVKWRIAMDEEITSIEKNDTWRLVPRPNGKKKIGVKWIYKEKKNIKWRREDNLYNFQELSWKF